MNGLTLLTPVNPGAQTGGATSACGCSVIGMFQLADVVEIHEDGSTLFTVIDVADEGAPRRTDRRRPRKYPRTTDPTCPVYVTLGDTGEDVPA